MIDLRAERDTTEDLIARRRAIGRLLVQIRRRFPDRVSRRPKTELMPGTYVKVREGRVLLINDWLDAHGSEGLDRVIEALQQAWQEMTA